MDPILAQRLFDEGKISQATYNSVIEKQEKDAFTTGDMFERLPEQPAMPETVGVPVQPEPVAPVTPGMEAQLSDIVSQPAAPVATPPVVEPTTPVPAPAAPISIPTVVGEAQTITSKQKTATEGALKAQEDLEKSLVKASEAEAKKLDVDRQVAAETYNLEQERQKVLAEAAAAEKTIRDKGLEQINNTLAEIDQKTAELSERKYEGYWSNKSTGEKIAGALALALGAYGSALSGGRNTALTIINKAMDDDFNQYKDATKNRIAAINSSRLNIKTKRQLIDDQIAGLQAKKEADILQVQSKIDNLANKFADPRYQAKLEQLRATLDQQRAKSRLDFEKDLGEQVTSTVNREIANIQIDPKTGLPLRAEGPATPGEIALDKAFAKDYNDWTSGGSDLASSEIEKLKGVIKNIKDGNVSLGRENIAIPDALASDARLAARADVQSTVMNSLRAILGAQFTEKEGERIIQNTWNENESEENNIKRLERLVGDLENQARSKNDKARYFEEKGSLSGYKPSKPEAKASSEAATASESGGTSGIESFARGAQDVTPGGATIEAAGKSFLDDLREAFNPSGPPAELDEFGRPKNPEQLTGTFGKRMEEVDKAIQQAQEDNPNLFTAGQISGVAAGLLGGGAVVGGGKAASKAAQAAKAIGKTGAKKVSAAKSVANIYNKLPKDVKGKAADLAKNAGVDAAIDYVLGLPGLSTLGGPMARKILGTLLKR